MELTLEQLNDMRTWTRDGTVEAICGPNNWVAILDLAEQALLMKAALSPERAEKIADYVFGAQGLEYAQTSPTDMHERLRRFARAARGEK